MNAPAALPLSAWLRSETRIDHARVDAAYGRFDLTMRAGYTAFLTAHARILPAVERFLAPADLIAGWQGRSAALRADLASLLHPMPDPAPLAIPDGEQARWGAIYVLEGSRLGGAMLARTVPDHAPRAFLSATHGPGEWRAILACVDKQGQRNRAGALAGATATFNAFIGAAMSSM